MLFLARPHNHAIMYPPMTASADPEVSVGTRNPVSGSGGIARSADAIDTVEGLPQLFLFGLQHVLVMYAGTVAVPLILGSALHFTPKQVIALISADLFTPAWRPCCRRWAGGSLERVFLSSRAVLSSALRP